MNKIEKILTDKPGEPEKTKAGPLKVLAEENKSRLGPKLTDLEALELMRAKHKAISFLEKFKREKQGEKQGFEIGEKVAAPFVIVDVSTKEGLIDKTKIGLLVERIDTRVADTFIIDVSPEEYKACQENKGMEFNGVVEVAGPAKYVVSNMFNYPAKALELEFSKPINPDNVSEMALGENVILEGRITDFRIIEHSSFKAANEKEPSATLALLTIETPKGENISVQIDPNVKFESSSDLENMRGKVPAVGDVVRINASVASNRISRPDLDVINASPEASRYYKQLLQTKEKLAANPETQALARIGGKAERGLGKRFGQEEEPQPKVLTATWCRSTYLITPNKSRNEQYQKLRQEISTLTISLEKVVGAKDFSGARDILALLIKKEVTAAERLKLDQLAARLPAGEKPLMLWDRHVADDINNLFDTDIDRMTLKEFYSFAKEGVATPYALAEQKKEGDHSYLFRIMPEVGMPIKEQEEIISLSIDTRWQYFEKLRSLKLSYDHKKEWSDKYMLDTSLKYLAYLKTPSALLKLIDVSDQMVFAENLEADDNLSFIFSAISGLRDSLYIAEDAPSLLAVFKENLDRITAMEQSLAKLQTASPEASRHYSMEVQYLRNIIEKIS
ncbi:MAG: hypothetical protein NTX82_05250 [Candidatus Parcubacteria bacterium]|nr:hypothetical protein [Candidatus Parcubacteria bacterium]